MYFSQVDINSTLNITFFTFASLVTPLYAPTQGAGQFNPFLMQQIPAALLPSYTCWLFYLFTVKRKHREKLQFMRLYKPKISFC